MKKTRLNPKMHDFTDDDFDIHIGKSGRIWLVGRNIPYYNIYVSDPNPKSSGFGGGEITWSVASQNCKLTLKGAWHAGTSELHKDTGVDMRMKHMTQGVVAKSVEHKDGETFYSDIIHYDEEPVEGFANRIEAIAKQKHEDLGCQIWHWSTYLGGGYGGPVVQKLPLSGRQ